MTRRLVKDATIYGLGAMLAHSLALVLVPLYTRYLPVSDYGILSLLNTTIQLVSFITLLGVSSAAMRFYFEPEADDTFRQRVYGNATAMLLVLPLLNLLVLGPLLWWLNTRYVPTVPFYPLVLVVILIGLFTPMIKLVTGFMRVQRMPRAFVLFNLAFFMVQTATISISLVWLDMGIVGQVLSQLLTNALFAVIAFYLLTRITKPTWSMDLSRRMLAFGVPLVPFFVFTWVGNAAGRFFLERFGDLEQVGLFSLASQFAGVIQLLALAFDNALMPHFLAQANETGGARSLGLLVTRYVGMIGLLCLGVIAASTPFILLVTSPEYHAAAPFVAPLTLVVWLTIAAQPLTWSLNHSKRTGMLSALMGVSTIALVLLLALFVGGLDAGIEGVVLALAGSKLLLLGGYLVARRYLAVALPLLRLAGIIAVLLASGLAVTWLAMGGLQPLRLAAQVPLLVCTGLVVSRLAGINNLRSLLRPGSWS